MGDWQRCPVCEGRGWMAHGFYNPYGEWSAADTTAELCRACQGAGIVRRAEPTHSEGIPITLPISTTEAQHRVEAECCVCCGRSLRPTPTGDVEALEVAYSEADEGTIYEAYSLDPQIAFEEAVGRLRVIRDYLKALRSRQEPEPVAPKALPDGDLSMYVGGKHIGTWRSDGFNLLASPVAPREEKP